MRAELYDRTNLTKRQLMIWAKQVLVPEVPLFNMVMMFEITGEVSPEHFSKAFQAVVDGSDALRTVVVVEDGVPMQRIVAEIPYDVELQDLSNEPDPDSLLGEWVEARRARRLPLDQRLFDSVLIKLAPDRYLWYLCQHHLIADAWSAGLVYSRVAEAYGRSVEGASELVGDLPHFQTYVDFERKYRQSERCEKDGAYWQQRLAKAPVLMEQATRAKPSDVMQTRGRTHMLSPESSKALRDLAGSPQFAGITPSLIQFNLFTTLLFVFLNRGGVGRQLTLGAPFHNRASKDFQQTIGLFMEICPVRVEIEEGESFVSLYQKVAGDIQDVLLHSQHGVGNPPERRAYDVLLNFNTVAYPDFHGLPTTPRWPESGYEDSGLWLTLKVQDFGEGDVFALHFDFNAAVYDDEQVQEAIKGFLAILEAFLADAERPIAELDQVPISGRWSPQAATAPADGSLTSAPPSKFRQPTSSLERRLSKIWCEVCDVERIGVDDRFFESGGDSLAAIEFMLQVEKETGTKLAPSVLFESATIAELAKAIEGQVSTRCLVTIQPSGSKPPFFCVHDVSGDVLNFVHLARYLGPDQPFYGLRARSLSGDAPILRSIEEVAADFIKEMKTVQPHGPYYIGGFSFGGYVAYEMARQLRAQGEEAAIVALLDTYYMKGGRKLPSGREWLQRHIERFLQLSGRGKIDYVLERVKNLFVQPILGFWHRYLTSQWSRYRSSDMPLPWSLRNIRTINIMLVRFYEFPTYEGKVVLFRAKIYALAHPDSHDGWNKIAKGGVESVMVSGAHHYDLLSEPHVFGLADALTEQLDNARAEQDRLAARTTSGATSSAGSKSLADALQD